MTTYYNEWEPYCAEWLRNLIAAGLIPDGEVDERSIVDVQQDDLRGFDQYHFFAGIGGWPYALRLAGWPDDRYVWTGSCPCQPLSCVGQHKGHVDERHLWPAFYRLIAECRPTVLFGEQVGGKDGREWLAAVRADLEATGYAVGASDLPACSVGANHKRQRLFFVANSNRECWEYESERFCSVRLPSIVQSKNTWASGTSQSPLLGMDDGIPGNVEQLRAYGNALVPQVAAEFIRAFIGST